jgi:hypothetical protein
MSLETVFPEIDNFSLVKIATSDARIESKASTDSNKRETRRSAMFVENLPYAIMILLGASIFLVTLNFSFTAWLSTAAYIIYGIVVVFWMATFVCPYCQNFGGTCPSGHGQISARFKKKNDEKLFAKKINRSMPAIFPIYVIPIFGGLIFFVFSFNFLVLMFVVVFAVAGARALRGLGFKINPIRILKRRISVLSRVWER